MGESLGIGKLSVCLGKVTHVHMRIHSCSYLTRLAAQQCVVIPYGMKVPLCASVDKALVKFGMQKLQGGNVIAEGRAANPTVVLCSLVKVRMWHR